jgi:hypothetical protein
LSFDPDVMRFSTGRDDHPSDDDKDEGVRDEEEEDDEEFEEGEDPDEEDVDADEDVRDEEERKTSGDRAFTGEVGSVGGSKGTIEAERNRDVLTSGSEAGTTAQPPSEVRFDERKG